jgi:DNA-binding response OmpR family regulator
MTLDLARASMTWPPRAALAEPARPDTARRPARADADAWPDPGADGLPQANVGRVTLIADDAAMALPWQRGLAAEGIVCSAREALADALLLLVSGGLAPQLARVRELRAGAPGVPLLVACPAPRELDQILALELGADDVIDTAVSAAVVAARLRALWRRRSAAQGELAKPRRLQFGALALALDQRRVTLDGRIIDLTEGEFEVLWLLASHAGQTLTRHEILKRVRGLDDHPLDRSIDSRIYRIRAKLGDREAEARGEQPRIRTVRNRGYVFSPSDW